MNTKYNDIFVLPDEESKNGKIYLDFPDIDTTKELYKYFLTIIGITIFILFLFKGIFSNTDFLSLLFFLLLSIIPFVNIFLLSIFITGFLSKLTFLESINSLILFFIVMAVILLPFIKILNSSNDKYKELYYELAKEEGTYQAFKKIVLGLDSLSRYIAYSYLNDILERHINSIRSGNVNQNMDIETLVELKRNLKNELDVEENINIFLYKIFEKLIKLVI